MEREGFATGITNCHDQYCKTSHNQTQTEILQEQRKNASAKKLQLDAPAYDLLNPYWSIGKTSAHPTGKIPPRNTKACRNEGFGAQHFTRNRDLALCLTRLGDEGITLN
ncbi:hypothetical protein TWF706_010455 [Orbilia oligospora]|nr:hypothetical protein TWF706_010455 [Orbilia oligospora]